MAISLSHKEDDFFPPLVISSHLYYLRLSSYSSKILILILVLLCYLSQNYSLDEM